MTLNDANERTPLIQPQQKNNLKKTIHIYGTTIGFLFLFSLVIQWYRTWLPTPLSDVQAKVVDDFSGIHAYNEYLSHFVAPHSANTRENGIMHDWIASVATSLQEDGISRGLKIDVIGNDDSKDIFAQDWFTPSKILDFINVYKIIF